MTRMTVRRTLISAISSVLLILVLAACQPGAPEATATPIGEVTRPDLVGLIDWVRSPSTVVFRAEVVGGDQEQEFFARNDIPACTVYGDNRVVWTTTTSRSDDGVAYDLIPDETIRTFVEELAFNDQFFKYNAGLDALPTAEVTPVVERITLFVNGEVHTADSFGMWPLDFFQKMLVKCRSLSQSPIEFLPDGGWVSAQTVDYSSNAPSTLWNNNVSLLNLQELATSTEPRWITGEPAQLVWQELRRGGLDFRFEQEGQQYNVV
ncbi:hypothetical protein, partial [Escherichia coli]